MGSTDGLSAPGTSTYDSSTMYVGDGTWDADRNDFLLPNLQGLNFATMQYNGMGNRFRGLKQYHVLITGHGVVAAITFMGLVPAAIFIARFYHSQGRLAYKLHVYLQILTVFLATVVLILGWFAVGPERSLTNPHHGIGVAIYTCVLVQFLYGWWMSGRERKRTRPHPTIPLKVHIHRLFGRAVALLAFVQIALGLTLYGSPKALFILYTLWGALLLFAYLTLEYRNKPRIGPGGFPPSARSDRYSNYSGSYLTGDQTELTQDGRRRDRDSSHWGRNVLAGAGALGAYEWWKGRRDKRREPENERYDERYDEGPDSSVRPPATPGPQRPGYGHPEPPPVVYGAGRPPSRGSYHGRRQNETMMSRDSWEHDEEDEKFNGRPPRRSGTWRDRILGTGAGIAAFEGVKSIFGSKKRRNDGYMDSDMSYRPDQTDVSRVEAGQTPYSPNDPRRDQRPLMPDPVTPTRPPQRRRPSMESMSYADDATSYAGQPPRQDNGESHTLRDSIATMGAVAGFREWNRRRKERSTQTRRDDIRRQQLDDQEQEFNRRNSSRYPGPQDASGRRTDLSSEVMTGPTALDPAAGNNPPLGRHDFGPDTNMPPLPAAAGTVPSSGAPASTVGPSVSQRYLAQHQDQRIPYNLPPPPPGPPPSGSRPANYQAPVPGSLQMPQGAVNPDPTRLVSDQRAPVQQSSGLYQDGTAVAANQAAAAAADVAASLGTQSQSPSRRTDSRTRYQRFPARGSNAAGSVSQVDTGGAGSPPVSVKVNMHPDGRHVTLRRLPEEEAARLREEKRRERRSRRTSSLSSAGEDPSSGRYRRNNNIRRSSDQPITNVPPPPAMSNSALGSHRPPSELNLPSPPPAGRPPYASNSPQGEPSGLLPVAGPASSGAVGSPGGVGASDVSSQFADARRRRRAERARKEADRGGNRVEFS